MLDASSSSCSFSREIASSLRTAAIRTEIVASITQRQAKLSPKFFYDPLGSKIFEAICELDEYYPTRTEAKIFKEFTQEISSAVGSEVALIDLGAGNCAKAALLFNVLKPRQYAAIDVSESFLRMAVDRLKSEYPDLPMSSVVLDFSNALNLPTQIEELNQKLFFYPGSSIGNFTPLQAVQFLKRLRNMCKATGRSGGAVLIGVDLMKNATILKRAYDDVLGVTAAFNLNILLNINRILGSNFDVRSWRHVARFNAGQSRIEMHLLAKRDLLVNWSGGSRAFKKSETIHTENSYKYTVQSFLRLLAQSGFGRPRWWSDKDQSYLVCYAEAI